MLLVQLLLGCHQLGLLHQLLQYHILHDSMPVALALLRRVRCQRCDYVRRWSCVSRRPLVAEPGPPRASTSGAGHDASVKAVFPNG